MTLLDKKQMHCDLVAKMLVASVNNAETAADVAMDYMEEKIFKPEREKKQKEIDYQDSIIDRSNFLSHEAKEASKRANREFMLKQKGHSR